MNWMPSVGLNYSYEKSIVLESLKSVQDCFIYCHRLSICTYPVEMRLAQTLERGSVFTFSLVFGLIFFTKWENFIDSCVKKNWSNFSFHLKLLIPFQIILLLFLPKWHSPLCLLHTPNVTLLLIRIFGRFITR